MLVYFNKVSKVEVVHISFDCLCIWLNTFMCNRLYLQVPPSVPADKAVKAIRMKKVEEYCLDVKDPLPFSLPGAGDGQVSSSTTVESKKNKSNANSSKGADPPSYDDAMNNVSFQAQVNGALARELDSVLARELQDKLNSE